MEVYFFWWDEENIEHIADHGAEPYEAEEVIDHAMLVRKVDQGKYIAFGQTDHGRYLIVVFAPKLNQRLRVVTTRDMTAAEKRRFRC